MGIRSDDHGRSRGLWLAGLLLLLPFEPRRPTLPLAGFETTLLEGAAALAGVALLWLSRDRLGAVLRRPPVAWLLLLGYAAAQLLSASLAEAYRDQSMRFALRMAAMAGFALVVAALPAVALERGLVSLAAGGAVVALLAILEANGVGALDPLLGRFREMPFNVGGVRRASAGSEYPNLAAAMMMYGLLAGTGAATRLARGVPVVVAFAALLTWGLLWTYSRGALLAAGLGLMALAAALRPRSTVPLAALTVLVTLSATFAAAGEVFRLRLGGEGTADWYGAVYAPELGALTLAPGEKRLAGVRVTNAGRRTWSDREAFHLSYHWCDRDRRRLADGGRTALPKDVAPGESVVLQAEVEAPRAEGRYVLLWDMVHEHTTWFSGQGVRPAAVGAVVSRSVPQEPAERALAEALSPEWNPSRGELWRLALGMWRDHPWLGVGPDNYRRLYGPRAGRPLWDTRVFANSTPLEVAATTGLVGLGALAGAIASAGVAAWRGVASSVPGRRAVAASLLAVLAGLVAHGTVDYVLAFTGHYLLFGFAIGGASALSRQEPSWS